MSEQERYEEAPETKRSRNDTVEDALRTFMETLSKNDQPPARGGPSNKPYRGRSGQGRGGKRY